MSEEEIIGKLKLWMECASINNGNSCIVNKAELQGLLDLYDKEKEKKEKIINKLKEDVELASTTVKWLDERTKQVVPTKTIIVNESDYAKTILKIMEE